MQHILYYADDGPSGPCGQSCGTTSPHHRLYLAQDWDEVNRIVADTQQSRSYRKNARILHVFSRMDIVHSHQRETIETKLGRKVWKRDETDTMICDGDCLFWTTDICTCGLAHHLMPRVDSMEEYQRAEYNALIKRHNKACELLSQKR